MTLAAWCIKKYRGSSIYYAMNIRPFKTPSPLVIKRHQAATLSPDDDVIKKC